MNTNINIKPLALYRYTITEAKADLATIRAAGNSKAKLYRCDKVLVHANKYGSQSTSTIIRWFAGIKA